HVGPGQLRASAPLPGNATGQRAPEGLRRTQVTETGEPRTKVRGSPSLRGVRSVQKGWSLFFGAVLLAELGLYLAARFFVPGWGLPPLANAESFGKDIDRLYYVIEGPVAFFFILTEAILVYSLWRFAGKPGGRAVYVHGDHRLEMAWTAI